MKKIYTAPQADLLCFEPLENLASIFEDLKEAGGDRFLGSADGDLGGISGVIKT